jgi:hypothetical protein
LEKGEKNLQIIPQNISWVRLNDFAVWESWKTVLLVFQKCQVSVRKEATSLSPHKFDWKSGYISPPELVWKNEHWKLRRLTFVVSSRKICIWRELTQLRKTAE